MKYNQQIFDQTKIIVVYYPAGAGGKFLASMLGLSDSCLLMNYESIINDVAKGKIPSYIDKQNIILSELALSKNWNDFGIFTEALFRYEALMCVPGIAYTAETVPIPTVVLKMAETKKVLFMCIHNPYMLKLIAGLWKNISVIVFENSEKFINTYRKNKVLSTDPYEIVKRYYQYSEWANITGDDYPKSAPKTLAELKKIKILICRDFGELYFELENKISSLEMINHYEKNLINDLYLQKKVSFFDTNLYFNTNDTINEIKTLYQKFKLKPVDFTELELYHKKWIQAIDFATKISGDDSDDALFFEE